LPVSARYEAIMSLRGTKQSSVVEVCCFAALAMTSEELDCFAALAMTV